MNDEKGGDNDTPEEDKHDDSDSESVDTTPENPLLDNNRVNDGEDKDGVLSDYNETQEENDQAEVSTFNEEGLMRSTTR